MAKRFTDTNIWDKQWFRKLEPKYKCFWKYICDKCNHAGFWEVDIETASYFIGDTFDEADIKTIFAEHILPVNGKWFLIDFIKFQYNCDFNQLNPDSSVHKNIIAELQKYNIETLTEGLSNTLPSIKVKDKDKAKDKAKAKTNNISINIQQTNKDNIYINTETQFNIVWHLYPERKGRKAALKHYLASVKTEEDFANLQAALKNYLASERVAKGYIQNGSTWFNNWRDWIPEKQEIKKQKSYLQLLEEERNK